MATTMQPNLPSHQLDSSPVKANANITLSDVFPTPPRTANLESSPAPKRILDRKRDIATPSESTDENHLQKSTRIHAGDLPSASALTTAWDRQQFSKKRSQYYGEVFAYREPHNTAKDRVVRDSMIVAEIKLNCKLEVEQTFLSDFSFQLSEIYQRPESCIVVSLGSPQTMLFGGSSEPAYYMTISALASEFAPTKNKRSTGLVQGFMHESLGIAPNRGIIRFEPVSEENLATNGMTTLQEIEDMERSSSEDSKALRTLSRNRSRMSKRAYAPGFMDRGKTATPHATIHEKLSSGENGGTKPVDANGSEKKQLRARKSFMALFGR